MFGLGLGFAMRGRGACGVCLLQLELGEHATLRERAREREESCLAQRVVARVERAQCPGRRDELREGEAWLGLGLGLGLG